MAALRQSRRFLRHCKRRSNSCAHAGHKNNNRQPNTRNRKVGDSEDDGDDPTHYAMIGVEKRRTHVAVEGSGEPG